MMRKTGSCPVWAFLLCLSALLCGMALPAAAQNQTGSISGTLMDPAGAVLRGAQVSIPDKGMVTFTDQQGRFFFSGLDAGNYTVSVSYIGFQPLTKSVTVNPGVATDVNLQLVVASQKQTVLVTAGSASAEVEAVNEERAADNLIQVMPTKTITELPDRNLGDAISRMASVALTRNEGQDNFVEVRGGEPRLTNTTVDGFNMPSEDPGIREFDFFAVPSSIVDSVKVSKTLEANMDGDGIGGSVNLITKTASDTPTYQITAIGGYTPIENGRPNAQVYGTWGRRFGASKKLGFIIGSEYDFDGTGINDVEPTPDEATLASGQNVVWDDSQDIRTYMFHRPRLGFGGSLDYRLKPGSTIFLRYIYTYTRDSGDKSVYSLFDNTPGVQSVETTVGNYSGGCGVTDGITTPPCNTPPRFYDQAENARIYSDSIQLSGTHVLTNSWFAWSAAVGNGYFGDDPFDSGNFTNIATTSACQFNQSATTDYHLPQWSPACFDEINSPQNYVFTGTRRSLGHNEQINIGLQGSGAFRYHIGGHLNTLEIGAKFRSMHQYDNQYQSYTNYTGAGAGIPMSTFPNQLKQSNYYNGSYRDGYNVWYGALQNYVNQHSSDFTIDNSDKGVDSGNYGLVEHIPAFYVMNTTDFGNGVRLVLGLRAEITTDSVHNLAFDPNGNASPNKFSGSYYDILPSASLRFNAGPGSYMRLIYARGVSRPEEQWLAQDLSWGIGGNGAYKYTVSFGNPNLKAETGDDIDVLYDHYFKTFGVLSGGYFYKHLSLPPVSTQKILNNYLPPGAPPADQGTYLATYYINAGSAWISGVELQYLQHWTSLPGFLGGLGMNANYSYIGSQTSGISGRSDKPRLLENAPNLFNIGPTYNKGPVSMQMNLNYNGASIYVYQYTDGALGGPQGPLGDNYNYPHTQVDAQGGYNLPHGFQLLVSGLNLTNEEFGFYYGSPKYDTQREFYHPTFSFGLKWSPVREK